MGKIQLSAALKKFIAAPPEEETENKPAPDKSVDQPETEEAIDDLEDRVDETEKKMDETEEKLDDGVEPAIDEPAPITEENVYQQVKDIRQAIEELLEINKEQIERMEELEEIAIGNNPAYMQQKVRDMKDRVRPDQYQTDEEFGIMSPTFF